MSEYEKQARDFLKKFNLKVSATFLDYQPPQWDKESYNRRRYRIRITRKDTGKSLTFIFWDSIANDQEGKRPSAYDLLACTGSESYLYEDFEDFCSSFGYDADSRKAEATWKRAKKFAERINHFFTERELEQLREIQ